MANVHTFDGSHQRQILIVNAAQGSLNSAWVAPFADGGAADRAVFTINVGAITENVGMALFQAQDSTGTGRKAITGATITTITPATDETMRSIEIGPGAMDDKNGFKYVRAEVTVASGTQLYTVELIKHRLRYPGSFEQHPSYSEQVIVLG